MKSHGTLAGLATKTPVLYAKDWRGSLNATARKVAFLRAVAPLSGESSGEASGEVHRKPLTA
jgi:hypothetical protein